MTDELEDSPIAGDGGPAGQSSKAASQLMQDALANGKGEMPIACERCRRRKQKCDRKLPSCSNCAKSGHQCNVPDVTDRRRAAGAQSARLPKGYIEQLEAQVRFLETSIQEKLATLREQHGTPDSQPSSKRLKLDPESNQSSWQDRYMRSRMDLDGEENLLMLSATASMTHASAVNAQMELPAPAIHHDVSTLPTMSILSLSNIGDSNESGPFTFSKVLSSIIRSDGRNPALSTRVNPFFTDLADAIPHVLPDMASQLSGSTGRKHMDKYFRMVQFRYRVLDRKDTEEYYEGWVNRQSKHTTRAESVASSRSAMQEESNATPSATSQAGQSQAVKAETPAPTHPDSPIKNFIIYMVLAIGITLDEDSASHSAFFSNHFLFAAIRHFEAVLEGSEGSNVGTEDPIDTIRALLLLAIYSLYSPSAGPTWHFIGLAIRKAICLGYHMDMVQGEDAGPVDDNVQEERRWVFWTAYVLDRCICQALDRPFSIQDTDVTAKLPTLSKANSLDVFALHFIRYNLIRTDFMTHPTKNFTYHQTNLLNWRQSFPAFPPAIDQPLRDTIRDYFDGLYYGALLLLVKPNDQSKPSERHTGNSIPNATMTSPEHRKLSHIAFASIYVLRSAAKRVELSSFISWLIGYRVFKAGLVFLRSVLILTGFRRRYCTVEQVSSDLGSAMDVLTAVGSKFDDLKRYRGVFRILKRGFEKFLEAEKMGLRPPAFSTSDIDFSVVNIGTLKSLLEEVVEMLVEMSSVPPGGNSERERMMQWGSNNVGNHHGEGMNGMGRASVSKPFGNGALMTPPLTTPSGPPAVSTNGGRGASAPAATPVPNNGSTSTYPHHSGNVPPNVSPKNTGNNNNKKSNAPQTPGIMGLTEPTAVSVKWGNTADMGMNSGNGWNSAGMGMGRMVGGGFTAPSAEMEVDKDLYEILFGGSVGM
ncbi:hypothetical protein Dda_0042 [Drechslerella dactyloides]|uniref:Zn(2)-C6 fungal-type domain-containing protein n=1 Tax=Drechslerella dactyloides TaxID=74499 RepID=A0AAD6NN24_DREDA|nr:hypothetical protein Dda_0042 [Drechslerella dactyloides]